MMADKTRLELRTAIREVLREPTAARWSDTTINDYINNALVELSRALMRTKTGDVSVAAEAETVTPPADLLILNTLYWVDADNNQTKIYRQYDVPVTNLDEDNDEGTGTPDKFWFIDNLVYLRPLPTSAGTAKFEYYYILPELDTDDDVPILSGLNNYIKAYGVYEAYFDDGDPRYELWKQKKNEELASWMNAEVCNYSTGFKVEERW
jgi:hypothetical protein